MKKEIRNRNSKGQYHGYQQLHIFDTLAFRGNWINGWHNGYAEYHFSGLQTTYFIR